jgi:ankyrin repeat protein
VKDILHQSADAIRERTAAGQTPLHLAVVCCAGLEILLEATPGLIHIPDNVDYLPITYACYLECEQSIKQLLDKDCLLHVENDRYYPDTELTALGVAWQIGSVKIVRLLTTALAVWRRSLKTLAVQYLDSGFFEDTPDDLLLVAGASVVYNELLCNDRSTKIYDTLGLL